MDGGGGLAQEILYRYGELQRWDIAVTLATNLLDLVPTVYSVGSDDARLAIELFEQYAPHGVKARDLIHVAVMRRHGLARVISTDRHFDQVGGLNGWIPRISGGRRLRDRLLRGGDTA